MPLANGRAPRCSQLRDAAPVVKQSRAPLMGFRSPTECTQGPSGRTCSPPKRRVEGPTASLDVCSPTASPRAGQRPGRRVCLTRLPAPPGFLDLLALSSAPCLPALFHAGSAHGVRTPELCSSRAAVRRLRRPSLLAVGERCHPTPPKASPGPKPRTHRARRRAHTSASTSRCCSTRESATRDGCLYQTRAHSSPEHSPLQGALPHRDGSEEPPLMRLRLGCKQPMTTRYRVSLTMGLAGLSRELPTLLGFMTS